MFILVHLLKSLSHHAKPANRVNLFLVNLFLLSSPNRPSLQFVFFLSVSVGLTAQYEGRIQELEAIVADARRKHEEQLDKLRKEFEGVLTTRRTEGYRETNAHARTFGEDPSLSVQQDPSLSVQQMEAAYQAQLFQKEKELRDKEKDFVRRQDHYLNQISQLEAACDEATRREEEARTEVERIKMEHHSQLYRLQVPHAQPGVSELNT